MSYTFVDGDLASWTFTFNADAKTYLSEGTYYDMQGAAYVKVNAAETPGYTLTDFDGHVRLMNESLKDGVLYSLYPPSTVPNTDYKVLDLVFVEAMRYCIASGTNTMAQALALIDAYNFVSKIMPLSFVNADTLPLSLDVSMTDAMFVDSTELLTKAYAGLDDTALMATLANGSKMPWSVSSSSALFSTALAEWKADTTLDVVKIDYATMTTTENDTQLINIIQNGVTGGSLSNHVITGTAGNDNLTATSNNDTITGKGGLDTVTYASKYSNYIISHTDTAFTVTAKSGIAGGSDSLNDVEKVVFTNGTLRLDVDVWETSGEAYRLYQAAFGRTPDTAGLKYWINDMDKGQSHLEVASNFTLSAEYQGLYGTNPTDAELITAFYTNVLGRAPDQAGFNYWLNEVQNQNMDAAHLLINFSESAENVALVGATIDNGIFFSA